MKGPKNDYRSKYTQMIVKQTLLKLLADKPLNKIRVAELCTAADINRGTFYNHFYDVFDVYESIENSFFNEIKAKLVNIRGDEIDRPFFKEIMVLIQENAALADLLLIKDNGNSEFLNGIIAFVKDKFVREWAERHRQISHDLLEQIFSYNANGSIGIISDWVRSQMKQSPDEISDLIVELNNLILAKYFPKTDAVK